MLHARTLVERPVVADVATLSEIPDGVEGTRETLRMMSDIVSRAKVSPAIIALARAITQPLRGKDYVGEVRAVQQWVRRHVRYVRDVRGVETLSDPEYTVRSRAGDCDDHSMLVAALLEAIGHATRFIAVGRTALNYSHVYAETKIGSQWRAVETTMDWPLGRAPELPYRMVEHIR